MGPGLPGGLMVYKLELNQAYVAIIFPFLNYFFLFSLENTQ
jgi:hypothetical protein